MTYQKEIPKQASSPSAATTKPTNSTKTHTVRAAQICMIQVTVTITINITVILTKITMVAITMVRITATIETTKHIVIATPQTTPTTTALHSPSSNTQRTETLSSAYLPTSHSLTIQFDLSFTLFHIHI